MTLEITYPQQNIAGLSRDNLLLGPSMLVLLHPKKKDSVKLIQILNFLLISDDHFYPEIWQTPIGEIMFLVIIQVKDYLVKAILHYFFFFSLKLIVFFSPSPFKPAKIRYLFLLLGEQRQLMLVNHEIFVQKCPLCQVSITCNLQPIKEIVAA